MAVTTPLVIDIREARKAWDVPCAICGLRPTRWKVRLLEPDEGGPMVNLYCEAHAPGIQGELRSQFMNPMHQIDR